jgi:MFS family permease
MSTQTPTPITGRPRLLPFALGLIGAAIGFVAAYLLYEWLNPILEARGDWIREMQGFLFTLVPLGTALGAVLGWWLGSRLDAGNRQ